MGPAFQRTRIHIFHRYSVLFSSDENYLDCFVMFCRIWHKLSLLGDRTGGLVPFLINQASNGGAGAKVLLNNVKFLIDIFHVPKHTEETCMPPNNPNCKYHPSLPQFEIIIEANTESCEQGFRRLNMYFHVTRKRHDLSDVYSSGLLMNTLIVILRRI